MSVFLEILRLLKSKRKLWLAPIIFVIVVIGGLLILAQGSVMAPFIYTLF